MSDGLGDLGWIDAGTTFGTADIVHYRGSDEQTLDAVAGRFDLVLVGPHATAEFPRELEPLLAPGLTRRLQYDFSDRSTSELGRAWAEADERVLYIENPHPRLLFDPNRAHPEDPEGDLRECFGRLDRDGADASFGGVDSLRPVTFAGLPVLRRPATDAEWGELVETLHSLAERGSLVYRHTRDEVIAKVYAAKASRLASLDMATASVSDLNSARTLVVSCIHDTMNSTATTSGAIDQDRPPGDRLPSIVSLGNRGDSQGEARPPADGGLLPEIDVPTIDPQMLRSLQRALGVAFEVSPSELDSALALNSPYLGAYEVQRVGRQLRALDARAVVRHRDGVGRHTMRSGAIQWEFAREALMGPTATAEIRSAGTDWPDTDTSHLSQVVERLGAAFERLRQWNYDVADVSEYRPPRYR